MLEVARGNVPGMSTIVIRGHNPSQSSASGFVDVAEGGNLVYLTTAETMDIVSDDTDDTALGSGAQTVLINGLNQANIEVDRKVLADLAVADKAGFAAIAEQAKQALAEK